MQDKKNRDIVDSQGNVIKSIKDNKTKQFEYRFGYKYNFSRNDKFGNFKKHFCFVFEFLWNRWKIL